MQSISGMNSNLGQQMR